MTVRRGMTMGHPCPNFAASMPATRGLIAAPWTPASLSLFRGKRSGLFRTARRLTQNRAQRFHLNPVPRHLHSRSAPVLAAAGLAFVMKQIHQQRLSPPCQP